MLLRVNEELQTKVGKIVCSFTKCKIKVHFNSSHHDILDLVYFVNIVFAVRPISVFILSYDLCCYDRFLYLC